MPRLFTALEIPQDIAWELELMRGGVEGARWIDRDNYHITLRYIGDVDDDVGYELGALLDEQPPPYFDISLAGVGSFGGRRPRAIWAGVEAGEELAALQLSHENLCRRIGLPPESRNYTPHVTLARLRNSAPQAVQQFASRHNLYRSRPFEVAGFVLMSSRPSRGGGPYIVECSYPSSASMWSANP